MGTKPEGRARLRLMVVVGVLVATTAALFLFKIQALGYSLTDGLPLRRYSVTWDLRADGHGRDVRIKTFLPSTDARQQIADERNDAAAFHMTTEMVGLNRVATWSGGNVPDGATVRYSITVVPREVRYQLDPTLEVPLVYPASAAPFLRPEPEIQADAPEIARTLSRLGADSGPVQERMKKVFDFVSALHPRPFKGTTDALSALRLGEASCNGKSRLFVALSRAAGIPARLVGGLILETGSKRTSHQWVEAYIGGHWVPFCPTNGHFARLPERYLTLYYGDETLLKHTADVNFRYQFEMSAIMVPPPKALASFRVFNVWGLFERLGLPFLLLRTLLMLPIGALVVVLCRNVVGMPTFGTFLPALIAAAAAETGPVWGVAGVVLVVGIVALARWMVHRLELLHSPTLAILLAVVTLSLLAISLLAERVGLLRLAHITLFPIAVMAITAERFYLSLTERGATDAVKELSGTLLVMLACYAVMGSLALQVIVIGFPEVLLLVVVANIFLGRWVGMRLSEYRRFRALLLPRGGR